MDEIKKVRDMNPAAYKRYEKLLKAIGPCPSMTDLSSINEEAIKTLRMSFVDPYYAPCGRRSIEWLNGRGILSSQQEKPGAASTTINFIVQMSPEEREKWILENEQKWIAPTVQVEAIDVKAEEITLPEHENSGTTTP